MKFILLHQALFFFLLVICTSQRMAKAKRIVLDSMKDHLILHIMKKKMGNDTYDALVTPYKSVNINRNLLLKNKLIATYMSNVDTGQLPYEEHPASRSTCCYQGKDREWVGVNCFKWVLHLGSIHLKLSYGIMAIRSLPFFKSFGWFHPTRYQLETRD